MDRATASVAAAMILSACGAEPPSGGDTSGSSGVSASATVSSTTTGGTTTGGTTTGGTTTGVATTGAETSAATDPSASEGTSSTGSSSSTGSDTSAALLGELLPAPGDCSEFVLEGGSCEVYEVRCPESGAIDVALRVSPPIDHAPVGTIMFGSGSAGITFFGGLDPEAEAARIIETLRKSGYTTVERAWVGTGGWFGSDASSPLHAACRYSTLLTGVAEEIEGPLCAIGFSAGSIELAYALTWYQRDEVLEHALLAAGPVGELDLGCTGEWDCAAELDDAPVDSCDPPQCGVGLLVDALDLAYGGEPVCSQADEDAAYLERLAEDSPVAAPDLDLSHPVDFVWGGGDCLGIAMNGRRFAKSLDARGNAIETTVVPGAPHEVYSVEAGADVIIETLTSACTGG